MGLLTVAALLPHDWEKRLVDTNVTTLSDADLAWADIAMISAMTVQKDSALKLIERCKQAGLAVVAGGPMFTAEPLKYAHVDHLVLNEAEVTLREFILDFELGRARHLYTSHTFANLRQTPVPMWSLADLKHYGFSGVQYSRGCPFNCDFCNVTALFGRQPRVKSAVQVIEELNGIWESGWRGPVFFVDDNLAGNRKALRTELLPALIEWQRGHRGTAFNTQASINIADDPSLLNQLAEAGFDTVFIGIETPSADSLAECGKVQNKGRDLVADVKKIQRAGIQVQGGFIVGFDSDGPSIFQRQIDFIQKSGIATAMVGLLQAIPGTALYERLRCENRLRGDSTGDNVDGSTNIVTTMDEQTLLYGYRMILRHIYSPKHYYRRVRTFLRDYRPSTVRGRLTRERLLALFRTLPRLGVVGRERVQYWKLLFWTLCRRPRSLPGGIL